MAAAPAVGSENLKHVLDTARNAVDQEFQRAERFDAKARGQATLAGSWLGVTQAVAAIALRSGSNRELVIAIVALSIVQATAFFCLLGRASAVWRLRNRTGVSPETLEAMRLAADDPAFADRTIETYRGILEGAQEANERRAEALEPGKGQLRSPRTYWTLVLAAGMVEIVVALIARVV